MVEYLETSKRHVHIMIDTAGAKSFLDQRKIGPDELQIVHILLCYRKWAESPHCGPGDSDFKTV